MGGLADSSAGYNLAAAGAPSGQAAPYQPKPIPVKMCDKTATECRQVEAEVKALESRMNRMIADHADDAARLASLETTLRSRQTGGKQSLDARTIAKLQERDVIQRQDLDIQYEDNAQLRKENARLRAILAKNKIDWVEPSEPAKPAPIPNWPGIPGITS